MIQMLIESFHESMRGLSIIAVLMIFAATRYMMAFVYTDWSQPVHQYVCIITCIVAARFLEPIITPYLEFDED